MESLIVGNMGANFRHRVLESSGAGGEASSLNGAETSKQHQCYGYSISKMLQRPQIPTSQKEQKPLIVLFYFPV